MKCKKLDFEQCVDQNIRRDKERSALVCEPAWHVAIVEEFVVPGPFKNGLVYSPYAWGGESIRSGCNMLKRVGIKCGILFYFFKKLC